MEHHSGRTLENFRNSVGIKFQLYNSLFTSLPFHRIEKTGILLPSFLLHCEDGFAKRLSPEAIVESFFERFTTIRDDREKTDLLFRIVQYVERQVVLFDAIEEAAFNEFNDVVGSGTLKQLETKTEQLNLQEELSAKLKDFAVCLVLTAHPTQFYPGSVLGIINDLSRAIKDNQTNLINTYLQQLGKTPLFKKQKPTPYDEAISLVWYLENVFYNAIGRIVSHLREEFPETSGYTNPIVKMGFWPGGDRDGNPNVTADITIRVADALRSAIIKCYYLDVRRLKRRLTFKGVDTLLAELEVQLYNNIFIPGNRTALTREAILETLQKIRTILIYEHNGLFLSKLDNLLHKVEVFGLHFATLDIRQESSVHGQVLEAIAEKDNLLPKEYASLADADKMQLLTTITGKVNQALFEGMEKDTLETFGAIRTIRQHNGAMGCNRYIISQCNSALNVLEVYGLFLLNGWVPEELGLDIVPLFETIDDLKHAPAIMRQLYEKEAYAKHLKRRGSQQTIMVGFSDGTKDGGYLMANWSIYKAKEELTAISREFGIEVIFFDGRGGPPARGGGKTHKFYASMGSHISTREIHLTIQGQTVSSSFANIDAARFNIEQLLNAGISNELFAENQRQLSEKQEEAINSLAAISFKAYRELRDHPDFLPYLSEVSPLNYYSDTNISSRPSKRNKSSRLALKDLRAIPFVGAWSQLKQNVPGYYGLGTALRELEKNGDLEEIKRLYERSLYFKTLIDNSEMAMKKSFFPLTAYLADDPRYGAIWNRIYEEFELTKQYIFKLSGKTELMSDYPVDQLSIQMRERIVLPINTIQQYALTRLRGGKMNGETEKETLERLVVRTSFGIINAGRNSV